MDRNSANFVVDTQFMFTAATLHPSFLIRSFLDLLQNPFLIIILILELLELKPLLVPIIHRMLALAESNLLRFGGNMIKIKRVMNKD